MADPGRPSPGRAPLIRPRGEGEEAAVRAVVRRAWYSAYLHIYTRAEMDAVLGGRVDQVSEWAARRQRSLAGLVAEVDGVVVGVAGCALLRDGDGELAALYVLPGMQGCGIGAALFGSAVAELRGRGCRRMWVWALARSGQAVDFYRRRGCIETERAVYTLGAHQEASIGFTLNLHTAE